MFLQLLHVVWMEERMSKVQVFMEERPNSKFLCKKDPKLLTIFVCYIAMETRKEILCGGIKLYPSTKAHIQVGQFSIQVCPKYDVFSS